MTPRRLAGILVTLVLLALTVGLLVQRLLDPDAVRAALEGQAREAIGQPVRIGAVDWTLWSSRPRVVLLDVRVGEPATIVVQRVELTARLRALLSRRVEQAGLIVTGSRITLPLSLPLGGAASAGASRARPPQPDPTAAAALTIASVDRIALRDVELVVGPQRLTLDIESSLRDGRLAISRLRLGSERSSIEGEGELAPLDPLRGRLTLTARRLDLDELLTIASGLVASRGHAATPAGAPSPAAGHGLEEVTVDLRAAEGRALGQVFRDLTTRLVLTGETLRLDPMTLDVLGGRLTGRLVVDTSAAPTVVTLGAEVTGLDAAQLAALADASGAITGRLGGTVQLEAQADASGILLATARGTAALAVTDGTLPGLDLVRPVITAFGVTGTLAPGTRAFSRLGGTFTLHRGILSSTDLALESDDVDLRGRGTVTLANLAIDLDADLVLSEHLSAQAGRDLHRYAREGTRIVLPATVRGPLTGPTVFVDVDKALRRAARNVAEEQVKRGLRRLFRW